MNLKKLKIASGNYKFEAEMKTKDGLMLKADKFEVGEEMYEVTEDDTLPANKDKYVCDKYTYIMEDGKIKEIVETEEKDEEFEDGSLEEYASILESTIRENNALKSRITKLEFSVEQLSKTLIPGKGNVGIPNSQTQNIFNNPLKNNK